MFSRKEIVSSACTLELSAMLERRTLYLALLQFGSIHQFFNESIAHYIFRTFITFLTQPLLLFCKQKAHLTLSLVLWAGRGNLFIFSAQLFH